MYTNHHTIRLLVVLVALGAVTGALAPGIAVAQSDGPPEPPHRVYGDVTDGGSAVQGVTVEVAYQGSIVGTDVTDGDGYYDLTVEADAVRDGGTMTVSAEGVSQTLTWEAGGADELDLAVDGADDGDDGEESDDTPGDGTDDDSSDSDGGGEDGTDETEDESGDESDPEGGDDGESGAGGESGRDGSDGDDGGTDGDDGNGGTSGGGASGEDATTAGDAPDGSGDESTTASPTEAGGATATAATTDAGTDAESTATATGTGTAAGASGDVPTAPGGLDPVTLGIVVFALVALGALGYARS